MTGGKTFWAVAAQKFPAGMPGPITYGVTPADADDVTADPGQDQVSLQWGSRESTRATQVEPE